MSCRTSPRFRNTFGREPKHSHHIRSAISNGCRRRSTIPPASRHFRAPTHFRLPADHPVAAPPGEVLSVGNLTTLETTGQKCVAVLVADIGEVLARHADARRSGLLQTIQKVPFLFRHQTLHVCSTAVLHLVGGVGSRGKSEELAAFQQPNGCDNTRETSRNRD